MGSELGFFFFLMLGCVFILLNQVDGNIFRLKFFLMNRDFHLVQNDGFVVFLNFVLRILSYVSLLMPIISLAVWASGLIIKAKDFNSSAVGGISVLLVGFTFFWFTFGVLKIKWNNYQFNNFNVLCFLLAFGSFTAYQFVVIFMAQNVSYFGYSSVFLCANCMVMIIIVYLNMGFKGGTARDLLNHKMQKGQPLDMDRDTDFIEEISEERANKQYFPTQADVMDLFTIGKMNEIDMASAFGGGIQYQYSSLPDWLKRFITITLWCIATAILIVYSYVIQWNLNNSKLGFITMVAILFTDVILYLIYNSKIVQTATPLALTLFLNRLLLFVFGGDWWIYGYMVLYLFYAVILCFVIAEKRFPFESAFSNLNLDNLQDNKRSVDVIKIPEFLLGIITFIYTAIFTVLYVIEPDGIPLKYLEMDNWSYPYYINGVFCLLITSGFFCCLAIYRLFTRKRKRIVPKILYYIKNYKFDIYWIFLSASVVVNVVIGLIAYWITDIVSYFIVIALITVFVLLYLNAFLHYILNDYDILQNIDAHNLKIQKHNERLIDLKQKVQKFKEELKDGKSNQIGASSLGLAQNIIKQEKLKKQRDKELKRIQEANDQLKKDEQLMRQKTGAANLWASMVAKPTMLTNNKQYSSNQSNKEAYNSAQRTKVNPVPNRALTPGATIDGNNNNMTANQFEIDYTMSKKQDHNEDMQLVEDELEREFKRNFEGGDAEDESFGKPTNAVKNELQMNDRELEEEGQSDDESTDEELDPEREDEELEEKRQKKRMRQIVDWRDSMNVLQAFFKGQLRHNDYQIILSLIVAHAALILCAVLVCYDTDSYLGITICVPLVHYGLAIFSLIKVLSTDAKMTFWKYFFFFSAYAIQYGWGIANLFLSYNSQEMDPTLEGRAESGTYIVVYLIVIPFITSALTAVLKWIDDKGKFTFFFFIQAVLTFLQGIGMLVCAYVYLTFIPGVIISVLVVIIAYIVLQVWLYVKNDYYLPKAWTIVNITIVVAIIISATVVSFFVTEFRVFLGFSISIWVLAAFLFVYAFAEISTDYAKKETKPLFYSPWLFPVYIYNPKKNDVEPHNLPSVAMISGFTIMICWSVLASVWIYPHHVGVSLSILFEIFMIIAILFLVSISAHQLKEVTVDIDKKIIRRAWLEAKQSFVNSKGAANRRDLVTYEKMLERNNLFRNHLRIMDGRTELNMEEQMEGCVLVPDDLVEEGIKEWIDTDKVNIYMKSACQSYLYDIEQQLSRVYREELELIIQFQLLVVQQAENFQEQKKKYLFTFLNEKKAVLFALGIVINIPDHGSMPIRYARVITQIQKLTPEKQTMFNHLRDHFIVEQREVDERRKEAAQEEERKQKERQLQLAQLSKEKKDQLSKISMDTPVDEMPDCQMKFDKILIEAKNGKLFVDNQFKTEAPTTLGERCQNRGIAKWLRARDNPKCVLFKDKINHLDVVQGALGDCYFLSAISVLGDKFVKKIIISSEEEWRQSGSFCVQFFKDGDPEIIIIDDFFPCYGNGMWAFVKGGDDGLELWPMVLEKAYAKMYSSYSYIEAGKVQYALSDMTDGFPEQMDLKIEGKNIQVFWEKVKTLKRHGALMGAGSPENALGDRAINEMGIVQGHAYAVLDVQEVDGVRLMQLRNPHGSSGEEWKGDWSDTCLKWTQRMRNKVGYQDNSRDGVFWMDALDFIQQYSYLYICRILDHEQGWREISRNGRWKGVSAGQLPSSKNPKARLDFCPQYEITVTKPCDGFISLMQKDKENMFRGKHSIFFMVSKVGGKRIKAVDKNTMICKSGNPINLNIVTAECDFDKSVNYPYKFTLLIANTAPAAQGGEGDFEFSVYATDPNFKVKELPWPKDFPEEDKIKLQNEEEME